MLHQHRDPIMMALSVTAGLPMCGLRSRGTALPVTRRYGRELPWGPRWLLTALCSPCRMNEGPLRTPPPPPVQAPPPDRAAAGRRGAVPALRCCQPYGSYHWAGTCRPAAQPAPHPLGAASQLGPRPAAVR